jgi:hypothetical protein
MSRLLYVAFDDPSITLALGHDSAHPQRVEGHVITDGVSGSTLAWTVCDAPSEMLKLMSSGQSLCNSFM